MRSACMQAKIELNLPLDEPLVGRTERRKWRAERRAARAQGRGNRKSSGPHMVHSHTVHLPLGALLSPCTMCGYRRPTG